jgi:hypothetical protein
MDVKAEIDDLKRRVGDLEGALNVLSGQFGKLHPEVIAAKRESKDGFDRMDTAMSRMISRLDTVNTQVWSLRDDLPLLMRDVLTKHLSTPAEGEAN